MLGKELKVDVVLVVLALKILGVISRTKLGAFKVLLPRHGGNGPDGPPGRVCHGSGETTGLHRQMGARGGQSGW